jgi:Family of unknown function (DUF6519)
MDGDFKGDFTRDTFYPFKHFSRVLMQQGRVQLDADWNEQTDILTRYLRKLAGAIIGLHGGPEDEAGFVVSIKDAGGKDADQGDFFIGSGDYYIDGILIESDDRDEDGNLFAYTYNNQPYYSQPVNIPIDSAPLHLVYLDIWEEQVTYLQDGLVREVALGEGRPDTATRAQIVWQVKLLSETAFNKDNTNLSRSADQIRSAPIKNKPQVTNAQIKEITLRLRELLQPSNCGLLKARAKVEQDTTDACITPPESKYRGDENQLYRVEIHQGDFPRDPGKKDTTATFKWSRDNGSVVFPITSKPESDGKNTAVIIGNVGRDGRLTVEQGDWVEIVDDDYTLQRLTDPLLKVSKVDRTDPLNIVLTLQGTVAYQVNMERYPILRRWDQRARSARKEGEPDLFDPKTGTINIVEGIGEGKDEIKERWITLEDGVQIQFQAVGEARTPRSYRPGDYWLIPARTIPGDVEWPVSKNRPDQHLALPPHGVERHYAPLAIIHFDGGKIVDDIIDLRYTFKSIGQAG